jgi:hypothetical protein
MGLMYNDLKGDINDVKNDIKYNIHEVNTNIKNLNDKMDVKFDKVNDELKNQGVKIAENEIMIKNHEKIINNLFITNKKKIIFIYIIYKKWEHYTVQIQKHH